MRYALSLLLLAVLACGDSSGPKGSSLLDPTVLITNNTDWPVYFTWKDGQSVLGADTVAPRSRVCQHFLARADSAFWDAYVGDSLNTQVGHAYARTNWFHPEDRPNWTADVFQQPNFGVLMTEVRDAPC